MQNKIHRLLKHFFVFIFLLVPLLAQAGTRDVLFHQGLVYDSNGDPLNGFLNVTFRLYDSESAATSLWEEAQSVFFDNGVYTVELGDLDPFPSTLFDNESLFLGVQIEGDSEMFPRIGLFSVPFAQQAEVAVTALSLANNIVTSSSIAPGSIEGSNIATGAIGSSELTASGVTAGTYTLATITVDSDGRITSAGNGSAGDITGITAGAGLSGGGLLGDVILNIGAGTGISVAADSVGIADAGVGTTQLADDSVTGPKIADDAVGSSEIADGAIKNVDISDTAKIAGSKVDPDFAAQDVTTSGDISTTGSGDIIAAGDLEAAGGFKMMIGPFQETDLAKNSTVDWQLGLEGSNVTGAPMPWAGSIMGISVRCSAALGGGRMTVEPTINGATMGLTATLMNGDQEDTDTQAKDTVNDTFSAGDRIGCQGDTNNPFSPDLTLDCICLVFVEM